MSLPHKATESDCRLPRHSWDSHVHIFDPTNYPYAETRSYSPEAASYSALNAFNANLTSTHTPQHIVFVQPSPYGTDNSLIIDLLKNYTTEKCVGNDDRLLRAIAVFDPDQVSDEQLEKWNSLGVRGFRINTEASGNHNGTDYEFLASRIIKASERVKKWDWKCQLFISGEDWDHVRSTIEQLPIDVIADHQGGMKGTSALPSNTTITSQPGFDSLVTLARKGKVFVKISALYRSSKLTAGGYDDVEPLVKVLAEEVPEQLIWASDWPHTGSGANRTEENKNIPEKSRTVDDVAVLKNIRKWVGPSLWRKMTVETPKKLYQ